MSKQSLNKHMRSDKFKWIISTIVFILLAVMLAGVCMQLWAPDKYKPSEWGADSEKQLTEKADDAAKQSDDSLVAAFVNDLFQV